MSDIVPPTSEFRLDDLISPVDIALDQWGIAHIRADNSHDLFFAQGYNAARDRLWQIDLWRKRGLGLLAADFGPGYLAQDHASRLFLYNGDMQAEWAAYKDDTETICGAFVSGINAYVARVLSGDEALPPEFVLLNTKPSYWAAQDVVRIRSHCLTRNALSEVVRAQIMARSSQKADALRKQIEPYIDLSADSDLALKDIPLKVIDLFKLATAPVSFSQDRLSATLDQAQRWNNVNALGEVVMATDSQGSNNWAIAGSRSQTGRPIMATDPHRTHAIPSVRYLVHLSMPGFDCIGAGEPSAPGISLGHNGFNAFSLTISGADQEDVYVYETQTGNPDAYRYQGGWENITTLTERFEVKGYPAQNLPLRFTRHGPVVLEEQDKSRAYAIRTVWTEPGSAPYMASLSLMRAKTYEDYRKSLQNWATPSVNHLYADMDGKIAWQIVGKSPVRPNWSGLLPVAGDGRYEWQGFMAANDLPVTLNPEKGFVATANEMNISPEWGTKKPGIGYEWVDASRSERIHQVLEQQPEHSLQDSGRLQNDLFSMAAFRACKVLENLHLSDSDACHAAEFLDGWDYHMLAASPQAALFEVWMSSHLKPAFYALFIEDAKTRALLQPGDIQTALAILEDPKSWLETNPQQQMQGLVEATLKAAWADCLTRFGNDPSQWRWGDLHRLHLKHALSDAFPQTADAMSIAPIALGGSGSTPMYGAYRPSDYQAITGPSVRMIFDVGAWDNSLFVNLPGQSGDPASAHHHDLTNDWLEGRYQPLLYTKAAVEKNIVQIIKLMPSA
ncbi:penicillin acylase family protein [Pseudochrobactrum sp. MP213Fo]|uniref:penicillin acylase family protein n=1 Tax=Pseudochrobactrum sp. MP213Fo TaxID=3022250 RepID=UPI003BA1EA40